MDKTKKRKSKLIIESSSSSPSSSSKKTRKKPINKKKKLLIIESSSTPSPKELIKEKIEILNPNLNKGIQTDLKITEDIKTMSKQNVSGRLNEKFIELMEQLADIMLKQGEPFRARAYQKAQETIMAFPSDILSTEFWLMFMALALKKQRN